MYLKSNPDDLKISIHALREERDPSEDVLVDPRTDFNPRAPRGARHNMAVVVTKHAEFQSTRSAWSATTAFNSFLLK